MRQDAHAISNADHMLTDLQIHMQYTLRGAGGVRTLQLTVVGLDFIWLWHHLAAGGAGGSA